MKRKISNSTPEGATPHKNVAKVKRTKSLMKIFFRPARSDQRPAGKRKMVLVIMYEVRLHSPVVTVMSATPPSRVELAGVVKTPRVAG